MFESFRKFLPEVSEGSRHPTHFEHNDYRLAAAALLVHTAEIDGNMSDLERDQVHAVVKRQFGLDEATTDELVAEDFRGFGHVALLPCSDALRGLLGDAFTHRLNDALLADPAEIPRSGRLPPWRPKPIPADEYRLTEGPANLNEPLAAAETLAYASHRRAAADAMVP
jgi:Tellurite resistance protein TerB